MSGRYVPPHKRGVQAALPAANTAPAQQQPEDFEFQSQMWTALKRTLTGIINKVSKSNLKAVTEELFRENLVRGRGLLCQCLMRAQQADPDLTMVFAAIAAVINQHFRPIGLLLLRRLVCLWKKMYRRRNIEGVANVNAFIAALFCQDVVDEAIVLEIIITHLVNPKRTDDDVDLAARLIDATFKVLMERNMAEFHENILSPLRQMLMSQPPLSQRAQTIIESVLVRVQSWSKQRLKVAAVPSEFQLVPRADQHTHTVELDAEYSEEANLDQFQYDSNFEANEAKYEAARVVILGSDWEEKLLEQADAAEEEKWRAEQAESAEDGGNAAVEDRSTDIVTQQNERRIRESVYLTFRSSVRADEVAHKLLKNVIVPGSERSVCLMIVDCCCESKMYNKVYCLTAERLCKTFTALQIAFSNVLNTKFANAEALSTRHLEHIAAFWTHMLRTEAIRWNSLHCFDILGANSHQRVLMEGVLRGLATAMGKQALHERFFGLNNSDSGELEFSLQKLFPMQCDDLGSVQLAVDLFVAMGVDNLAGGLRNRFEALRLANRAGESQRAQQATAGSRKRERDHDGY